MFPPEVVPTVSVVELIPILVTVPPLPFPPPFELIVMFPFPLDSEIPVPAIKLSTPVFVIVTVPVFASELAVIPAPLVNVLYGLAQANKLEKLSFVLVNAAKSESDPAG
jgi:hypothetical protein